MDFHMASLPFDCPRGEPASSERASGTIRGHVTAVSGEPLRCARVSIEAANLEIPDVLTDEQGGFVFRGLPAGAFFIEADARGYDTVAYGQLSGRRTPVVLRDREVRQRVDIVLPRLGSISGNVVDEYGEPLQGVVMTAFRVRRFSARPTVVQGAREQETDDRGRYRITGLYPLSYVVSASATGAVLGDNAARSYAPVYYPQGTDLAAAVRVHVVSGQDVGGLNVAFAPQPTYTVSGRVVGSSGPVSAVVSLATSMRTGTLSSLTRKIDADANGAFVLRDVPPGDYVIQAAAPPIDRGPFGIHYVRVADRDPLPVTVALAERSTVEGHITAETTADLSRVGLNLHLTPVDGDTEPVDGHRREPFLNAERTDSLASGIAASFLTVADARFRIASVTGINRFTLQGACETCYLKSVTVEGIDATDTPYDFGLSGRTYRDVEVTISDAGGVVTGRVVNERGVPQGNFTVLVFSFARDRWFGGSAYVRRGQSNEDGTFTVSRLPPGDYWVAPTSRTALTAGEEDWADAAVLDPLIPRADRISVRERDRKSVTLRVQ